MAEQGGVGVLPMQPVATVDDLLDRARTGFQAGAALDGVKDELTRLRDQLYRQMLNAPADRVLEFRANLKAIETLAQALLVKEAQGHLAYDTLMEQIPGAKKAQKETPFRVSRVARKRSRRASGAVAK